MLTPLNLNTSADSDIYKTNCAVTIGSKGEGAGPTELDAVAWSTLAAASQSSV